MSVSELQQKLQDALEDNKKIQEEFEEFQELSRSLESELEDKIAEQNERLRKLEYENEDLQDQIFAIKKDFLQKTLSLEKNISILANEKNDLNSNLKKITKIARDCELDLEKTRNSLREKEFELEEVTNFYHKTLEDLAITCAELESIKDLTSENTQRLKDQISDLNHELQVARRKSKGLSHNFSQKVQPPTFAFTEKDSVAMVDSLISSLNSKLRVFNFSY